ncbi:MAG: hypothetical protein ACD_58C00083G0003 [uncultured bacterium]|nr:MAG: hypothetical protein ACD_58C00083G0003 [uncultured bacterium]
MHNTTATSNGKREIVTEPIFITDRNMVDAESGSFVGTNARLWEIRNLHKTLKLSYELPEKIFMVDVEEIPMQNPLTNRMSAGAGFSDSVQMATYNMYKCFSSLLEEWVTKSIKILQVIIPNGGLPMNINAFANKLIRSHNSIFQTCEMKLSRKIDPRTDDYVTYMQSYRGEDSLDCEIAFINDTATASGSTAEAAASVIIHGYKDMAIQGSKQIKVIFFFTICGSKEGLVRAYQVCKQAGVIFIPVFYNAIFEVVDDKNILPFIRRQTDLPLANNTSITTAAIALLAKRIYNSLPMCAVGDTGNRLIKTTIYFIETLLEILLIEKFKENFDGRTIDLDQPEWSRAKRMLASDELVDITWHFYEISMEIHHIKEEFHLERTQQKMQIEKIEGGFLLYLNRAHVLINQVLEKERSMNPILANIASLIG